MGKWRFWVDRGGTFTDIIAISPQQEWITRKLLSQSDHYKDATIYGIQQILNDNASILEVRMGTTLATNALLEHKGAKVGLVTTKGFRDAIRIGYQNRPNVFAREILRPKQLYEDVIEVEERIAANGKILKKPDLEDVKKDLLKFQEQKIKSLAIVFVHGYRYPVHEEQIGQLATEMGFEHIALSHKISPLIKYVSRGETTIVDAYLTPILQSYVAYVKDHLKAPLYFMQSNGGLTEASCFRGKDAILSGPAGGLTGATKIAEQYGFSKIIGFDMGGTSTDVAYWNGNIERRAEAEIAGVKLKTPMLKIHTIASGGGSLLEFDGERFKVGPESAGATP